MVTRAELFALAHAAGHTNPAVMESRRGKFFSTCSCGYQSTSRRTFEDALGAGVHHALKAGLEIAQNGVSSPRLSEPGSSFRSAGSTLPAAR